jgi:hypothetical protein
LVIRDARRTAIIPATAPKAWLRPIVTGTDASVIQPDNGMTKVAAELS